RQRSGDLKKRLFLTADLLMSGCFQPPTYQVNGSLETPTPWNGTSRCVTNAFSFCLLVDRLGDFFVESVALSSFCQPLVLRLNIGITFFRELLNFLLQTISFHTGFGDTRFQLIFR